MPSRSSAPRLPNLVFAVLAVLALPDRVIAAGRETGRDNGLDLVAVAIIGGGQAVRLATPGIPERGRQWRSRSFDTSDLPQPILSVSLSASGTKLVIQPAVGPAKVIDLTSYRLSSKSQQYIDPVDSERTVRAATSHRLPGQRFVTFHDGLAYVIDDEGARQADYPVVRATHGAISRDGLFFVVNWEGTASVCGEGTDRHACRELPWRPAPGPFSVHARSGYARAGSTAPRFVVVAGTGSTGQIIDPEQRQAAGRAMRLPEARLRALLQLESISMADTRVVELIDSLLEETAQASPVRHQQTDWHFYSVAPDEQLYAPVLEFARQEEVFPSAFETIERLRGQAADRSSANVDSLYERYLRQPIEARRNQCAIYSRVQSTPGSWLIEYWLYYPFDVGGFSAHLHDPEHLFIEVDKLGSAVRRAIGGAHGYVAGNNFYNADKPGAAPATLPLFAIVELGKHASAPDMDRDGTFTPGLDENEYYERARIWGVRDVIGSNNNHLLPYDRTMMGTRRPAEYLAPASVVTRFPQETELARSAACQVLPMPVTPRGLPACHDASTECAQRSVASHPDFRDSRRILKQWVFPSSFLRATYGMGPRFSVNRLGAGWSIDMARIPGLASRMPLPGRIGADVFYWRQDVETKVDKEGCINGCQLRNGIGWEVRYERSLSNLFGYYGAVRSFTPPVGDAWIAFGPSFELPLFDRSNINVHAGVAFRPSSSPRFEMNISIGLWKPKTNHVGIRVDAPKRDK